MILLALLLSGGLWEQAELWRQDGQPLQIDLDQRLAAKRLFSELLAGAPAGVLPADLDARAAALGLQVQIGPDRVILHGPGGIFAVHLGDPERPPLVLQAPHAWYDYKTGRIASALFDEGVPRALFLNGGQRYGGNGQDDPAFDLAHNHDTLYQAATLGAAAGLEDPLFVQLHGFTSRSSKDVAVVSRGSALEPLGLRELAIADLSGLLGFLGSVGTGEDNWRLAARDNAQGQALSGQARFLHLELGKQARRELADDPELRAAFGALMLGWTR